MSMWFECSGQQFMNFASLDDVEPLAPPPGLEGGFDFAAPMPIAPPPGLETAATSIFGASKTYQVCIQGLPNSLLTADLMEVVLEQAGLEDVVGFTCNQGWSCGEAIVGFASEATAQHCIAHFSGCSWDYSGAKVDAYLCVEPADVANEAVAEHCAAHLSRCGWDFTDIEVAACFCADQAEEGASFRADRLAGRHDYAMATTDPAFIPTSSLISLCPLALAAAIPTFSAGLPAAVAVSQQAHAKAAHDKPAAVSDASTDAGESEVDEERASLFISAA